MSDFTSKLKPAEPDGSTTLTKERSQSNVPAQLLSEHLFANDGFLQRQARVLRQLVQDPLMSKAQNLNLSRPDRYKLGLARAKAIRRLSDKHGWNIEDSRMAEYLVDEMSPYHLTMSMFVTTVREQGNEEQRSHWLPQIESYRILGSYAQTELGHGSNVRGIETTATYDPQSKEFIIHSPTLTASKWWNGSLGRTATHAIIVAQLLLPDSKTSYGPHTFIVQVRDMQTHLPLQGIAIGDIGAKYGYPSMDNAYMLFNEHRVPHSALLSRYSHVDPETGSYSSQAQSPALVYGSLTYVRVSIIMHARLVLARACTVAVRYLAIRRQFKDRDSSGQAGLEMATLDYPTVQFRVLPLLATTFALHYSGIAMGRQYAHARAKVDQGDLSALSEMHATSSALKSLCTMLAADGIETCRRACGGHGFAGGSGLIPLNNDYLSKPTVEGDNWMITQQTASFLIKKMGACVDKVKKQKQPASPSKNPADTAAALAADKTEHDLIYYLLTKDGQQNLHDVQLLEQPAMLAKTYALRMAGLAHAAWRAREVEKKGWTELMIQLHTLAHAHAQYHLVSSFAAGLQYHPTSPSRSKSSSTPSSEKDENPVPQAARPALHTAFHLFALFTLFNNLPTFLTTQAISAGIVPQLQAKIQALMAELRPHAVNLVDAWAIPEYLLDSALGRHDGKVYEELFERAKGEGNVVAEEDRENGRGGWDNPLNRVTFNPYYWDEEIVLGSGKGWDGTPVKGASKL